MSKSKFKSKFKLKSKFKFKNKKSKDKFIKYYLLPGVLLLCLIILYALFSYEQGKNKFDQSSIVSAIVNVSCPANNEKIGSIDQEMWSGSGFILYGNGIIVTNAHVIPRLHKGSEDPVNNCLVELPNSETGIIEESYLATPLVTHKLSDTYDLAVLKITGPFIDKDNKNHGKENKKFPFFSEQAHCQKKRPILGQSLRVYGYPLIGGRSSLSITEGIISGFPSTGMISTSAKIAQGSSGGLAVDSSGCMLGIPSQIILGEHETMGMIINKASLLEFMNDVNLVLMSTDSD